VVNKKEYKELGKVYSNIFEGMKQKKKKEQSWKKNHLWKKQ